MLRREVRGQTALHGRIPHIRGSRNGFYVSADLWGPAHKNILCAFINDLLGLTGDARVVEVQHLPLDQCQPVSELKLSIVDVKATDALGRRFVVEMQVLNVEGFEKRVVYNVAKAYTPQPKSAEQYPKLSDVVGITIGDFSPWPDGTANDLCEILQIELTTDQRTEIQAMTIEQLEALRATLKRERRSS